MGTTDDIIFRNCTLPDGAIGSIEVIGVHIVRVGDFGGHGMKEYDMRGARVFPGAIDTHVHFRDFGQEHKEDWTSGPLAAVRGGVTTVLDMPNNAVPITTAERFEQKARHIGHRIVDWRLYLGATGSDQGGTNVDQVQLLVGNKRLCGLKIYNGSSTGNLLVTKREDIKAYLTVCRDAGVLPCFHAESEALMLTKRQGILSSQGALRVCDHCLVRDTEVEVAAVQEILDIWEDVQGPIYFCHISCPESVELIHRARRRTNLPIDIEVCPHHLFLDDTRLRGEDGAFYKMNPPLRSRAQVDRMREYVCTPGMISCIGSDHAPHTTAEKEAGDYDTTPSGVPGVQTLVPLMYELVREGILSIPEFIRLTHAGAQRIFSLHTKQGLASGADADFYFIDDAVRSKIFDGEQRSKCRWTPFAGIRVCKPILTVADGSVYDFR